MAVWDEVFFGDAQFLGNLDDAQQLRLLRDLDVRQWHVVFPLLKITHRQGARAVERTRQSLPRRHGGSGEIQIPAIDFLLLHFRVLAVDPFLFSTGWFLGGLGG